MESLFNFSRESDDEQWISVSDLMAVLMVIFLLVAIAFIEDVLKDDASEKIHQFNRIDAITQQFNKIEESLRFRLNEEFEDKFEAWNAELDEKELIIRFNNPKVFFETGEAELKEKFQDILKAFFPKYLKILNEKEFREYIAEIRIEGHTSSEWKDYDKDKAYLKNMELSQERTRAVLEFGISKTDVSRDKKLKNWAQSLLTANGLSSSELVIRQGGEDKEASRRVEFEIRTNFKEKIFELLKEYNEI